MIALTVAILCVLLPIAHLIISKKPRTRFRVLHILLLYTLVLGVGVIGLPLGFIPHVFFPDEAARLIGWPLGSPFQLEVGMHDGAWGMLGFPCIWIGGTFWLATGLGWSFFMLGACYGHIREMIVNENYAPYNRSFRTGLSVVGCSFFCGFTGGRMDSRSCPQIKRSRYDPHPISLRWRDSRQPSCH